MTWRHGRSCGVSFHRGAVFSILCLLQMTLATRTGAQTSRPATSNTAASALADAEAAEREQERTPKLSWTWRDVPAGNPTVAPCAPATQPAGGLITITKAAGWGGGVPRDVAEVSPTMVAFAGDGGLNLWDGKAVRTYTGTTWAQQSAEPIPGNSSLPSNSVNSLLADARGRLWVATSQGVCRIDGGRWRLLETVGGNAPFGSAGMVQDVQSMHEMPDGRIVLGSRGAGVTIIDPKTGEPRTLYCDGEMNHWICAIAQDAHGELWFGVTGIDVNTQGPSGLGVLRSDGQKVRPMEGPSQWLKDRTVRALCIDRAGSLWVGTDAGLYRRKADGAVDHFTSDDVLPAAFVLRLCADTAGRVWASTEEGIAVFDDRRWRYPRLADTSEKAPLGHVVRQTKDGAYWIVGATWATRTRSPEFGDVNPRLRQVEEFKRRIEQTYPKVAVERLIMIDGRARAFGYVSKRLLRYDGKRWEDISDVLKADVEVWSMHADRRGRAWVGTGGAGLIGWDGERLLRYNDAPNEAKSCIFDIAETSDGTLWVGTQQGLYRLDPAGKWEQTRTPELLWQVIRVVPDAFDRLWLADANNGIYLYDAQRDHFDELSSRPPLHGLEAVDLTRNADGDIEVKAARRPAGAAAPWTLRFHPTRDGSVGAPVLVKEGQ